MSTTSRRSTIYFDSEIHDALRIKAAMSRCSVSDLVNEAVRQSLVEGQEDLAAFEARAHEPTICYEALLNDLNVHGTS